MTGLNLLLMGIFVHERMRRPTDVIDGEFDNSKMLSCSIPPITDGQVANVTLNWNGEGGGELGYKGIQGRLLIVLIT